MLEVKLEDKHQGTWSFVCGTVSGKSKYVKWCRKSIQTVRDWHFLQREKRVQIKLSMRVLQLHFVCHKKVTTYIIFYLNANNFLQWKCILSKIWLVSNNALETYGQNYSHNSGILGHNWGFWFNNWKKRILGRLSPALTSLPISTWLLDPGEVSGSKTKTRSSFSSPVFSPDLKLAHYTLITSTLLTTQPVH